MQCVFPFSIILVFLFFVTNFLPRSGRPLYNLAFIMILAMSMQNKWQGLRNWAVLKWQRWRWGRQWWGWEGSETLWVYTMAFEKGPTLGFSGGSDSKESACNAGDPGLTPGLRRSPGEGMATHSSILFFFFCSGFCHTLKWNSHGFTCVPHPDPPSPLPLHPLPLGRPSAPGPNACLMHPTWAGDLFHPR